jgi:multicomponent Na+:H+ antiporter subunit D
MVEQLAPLPVVLPLLGAAALPVIALRASRRVVEGVALALAAATLAASLMLLGGSMHAPFTYWFGGWAPRNGVVLGISFVVDPLGAGLAVMTSGLVVGSFVYAIRYFDAVGALFHVLMLATLAGVAGLCLSGDLFTLFVFLEVMGVAAFALTGYEIEATGPLQAALNFAVTNSVAASMVLFATGLLYGRTGTLNLAAIGAHIARGPADGLIVVAAALLTVGFLVKAAIVPFHWWLPDAYASAPTPVCVLFTGVVSELGLFALARVHFTAFQAVLGANARAMATALVAVGAVTAVVGAVMCLAQDRLKRMLAFATVAHAGLFLIGVGLLNEAGVAGAALYIFTDGLLKAALFMAVGIVQHRLDDVDENRLHGKGRALPGTAVLFVAGGVALAGLPPFGPFLGKAMIEEAAKAAGFPWVAPFMTVVSVGTGGAILRAAARVFAGWGPTERSDPYQSSQDEDEPEITRGRDRTPVTMFAPALALLVVALGAGLVPQLADGIASASARFASSAAYGRLVLAGNGEPLHDVELGPATSEAVLYGFASVGGALAVAGIALERSRFPEAIKGISRGVFGGGLDRLRRLHSGRVGDYVAWLVFGAALVGGTFALTLRST